MKARDEASFIVQPTVESLESARTALVEDGMISRGRGELWILSDVSIRYRILGIGALPIIYENSQYLRLLELIARGRGGGAWSFNLCSALHVDAKQLFHLTNPLVDFGLVHRKSSVTIPRKYRSGLSTGATIGTFFIHSKFASSPTDPEISDLVDSAHSSDSAVSLITKLLRESGGVMTAKTLRRNVVVVGGFLPKQYQRGRQKLQDLGRVETVYISQTLDEVAGDGSDDDDDDDEDDKKEAPGLVQAFKLVDDPSSHYSQSQDSLLTAQDLVKDDPSPPITPEETDEEADTTIDQSIGLLTQRMEARNLLKANYGFVDSITMIIKASGDDGVTSGEMARITGISSKEISKVLEVLRNDENVHCEWKNEGRKKFIVYKWLTSRRDTDAIKLEDEPMLTPSGTPTPPLTPMSALSGGSGYVTAATVRRGSYVEEILTSRNGAISLIDLGRAIEAKEMAEGIGIPNTSIDRRTLRKICDIAKFPIIEKTEYNAQLPSNTTKLMIVYDPKILTAEQAAQRVDRPLGLTPSVPKTETATTPAAPKKIQVLDIHEIQRKSRLAAIAVFGDSQSAKVPVSVQVAVIYGYITADIYKARILHAFLVSAEKFWEGKFRLQTVIDEFDLLMYLKVLGCGLLNPQIDSAFNDEEHSDVLTTRIADVEAQYPDLRSHLRASVMGGTGTETSHLSRIILPLVRLGILQVDKAGYSLQRTATIEGLPSIGETVAVDISTPEGVEEYWRILHRYCSMYSQVSRQSVPEDNMYGRFPGLLKMSHWRSKVLVSLAQRRVLKKFLRSIISANKPIVVDGSNEQLVKICAESKIEVAVALKALSVLLRVVGDERVQKKIVFAHVMQARFSCHVCGKIFYQFYSIKAHYQQLHGLDDVPKDTSVYTRQEYLEAVEKLRKGPIDKNKRRRRRNRNSQGMPSDDTWVGFNTITEEREWRTALALAKKLGGPNVARDQLWRLVAQIKGIQTVPEMIVQRLTRDSSSTVSVSVAPKFVHPNQMSDGYRTIVNMLVFNKILVESDMMLVQQILSHNQYDLGTVMDHMRSMRNDGILIMDRSSKSYGPSRQLKVKIFGKYSEIDSFLQMMNLETDSQCIEGEDEIQGVANSTFFKSELYFDIGSAETIEDDGEGDGMGEEEEAETDTTFENTSRHAGSHTGIQKHLSLSRDAIGGEINRIEISQKSVDHVESIKRKIFLRHLMKNFDRSYIWRPNKKSSENVCEDVGLSAEFREPRDLVELTQSLGFSTITRDVLIEGLRDLKKASDETLLCLEILQLVTISRSGKAVSIDDKNSDIVWFPWVGREQTEFGKFLSSLDLRWFSYYYCSWGLEDGLGGIRQSFLAETKPRMRIASFTNSEGIVNEQLILDLFANILHLIYSTPGLSVEVVVERTGGILALAECDLILSSLHKLGLVYQENKEWFIEPNSN